MFFLSSGKYINKLLQVKNVTASKITFSIMLS